MENFKDHPRATKCYLNNTHTNPDNDTRAQKAVLFWVYERVRILVCH